MNKKKDIASIFQGWLLGVINGIDKDMLQEMIVTDDASILFDFELPPYFVGIKDVIKANQKTINRVINIDTVIKYAYHYRPDLALLISQGEGKKWMTNFLKMVKFMIMNIDLHPEEMKAIFYNKIQQKRAERMQTMQTQQPQNTIPQIQPQIQPQTQNIIPQFPRPQIPPQYIPQVNAEQISAPVTLPVVQPQGQPTSEDSNKPSLRDIKDMLEQQNKKDLNQSPSDELYEFYDV